MYAVIFRAEIAQLDDEYYQMAARMRDLALQEYGCLEFTAVTEGNHEIAISYWRSKEQIRAWKENAEHRLAQQKGRTRWYTSYRVQIVEVVREYNA
ncbi:antibiotic biosynthesis monooxygenase family protein [Amphritea pacifica]|uniref:Antibiotic biosynthesis monooxygenase n=1 Tax=Amphritea pacifica TaxID=2811233 RepID=A0ABS2WA64_9GAMM|nr:antibiotic biosynthesis monooxygenase [Amphritea pacifica]MBN0988237.1 antibiotic biosynthesis monooxygenase [Amphritea pacifica]